MAKDEREMPQEPDYEPLYKEAQDFPRSEFVIARSDYLALRSWAKQRIAELEARVKASEKDARLGLIFGSYWDRLSDPTPEDRLEQIVAELLAAARKNSP